MEKDQIIAAILRLPRTFWERGTVAFGPLLKETGYVDVHRSISVQDLRTSLAQDPTRLADWETWSSDQRSHPAWYFKINDDTTAEIGLIDVDTARTNQLRFNSPIDACAEFIKIQIEEYRQKYC